MKMPLNSKLIFRINFALQPVLTEARVFFLLPSGAGLYNLLHSLN